MGYGGSKPATWVQIWLTSSKQSIQKWEAHREGAPKAYNMFYNPLFEGFHNIEENRGFQENRVENKKLSAHLMLFVVKSKYLKNLYIFLNKTNLCIAAIK